MLAHVLKSGDSKETEARKDWSQVEAYRSPLSTKPFQDEKSTNLHAYVGADPVNFTDPSGLQDQKIVVTARTAKVNDDATKGVYGATFGMGFGRPAMGTGSGAYEAALARQEQTQNENADEQNVVVTASVIRAQRILPPRVGPPPTFFARPPSFWPRPPGWNRDWVFRYPESTSKGSRNEPRWYDPQGGSWRWHAPDRHHRQGHWDHNPHNAWNSQTRPIYPGGAYMSPGEWRACLNAGICI